MAAPISAVVVKQAELRGLIARAVSNTKKLEIKKRTPEAVQTRIEVLDVNWKKFQSIHETLSVLKSDERAVLDYFIKEQYPECGEQYIDAESELCEYLNELKRRADQSGTGQAARWVNPAPNSRQLPRINLPRFSGLYREWRQFRDLFASMISDNQEISNVEKMQHLKTSLTGEAAQLVKNIETTGENFVRAWQVLTDRYENKRVLIDTHLALFFSIQKVSQQSVSELKSLLGNVKEALGALKALGCPTETWDTLVYTISHKIDSDSLVDWEKQTNDSTESASFTDLEKFIVNRIRALEAIARATEMRKSKPVAPAATKFQPAAKSHQATVNQSIDISASGPSRSSQFMCSACSSDYYISACPQYRGKTVEQRQELVKQKNLYFNCLGLHQLRNCRTAKRCRICGHSHHTTLHRSGTAASEQAPVTTSAQASSAQTQSSPSALPRRDNAQASTSASTNLALTTSTKYTPVLLASALVKVTSCYGEQYTVRALLDQGSEVSFITEGLAQRINFPRKRVSLPINGIGAQRSTLLRGLMTLDIVSRINPETSFSINAYILQRLTAYLPPIQVFQNHWPHLQDLELADPDFSSATEIDLILGAEVYCTIIEEGLRQGGPGSPIAQQTARGWILLGSVTTESNEDGSSRPAQGLQCSIDHELLDLVQRFWVQEEPTAKSKMTLSIEEAQCEEHFKKTHSRTLEGRYASLSSGFRMTSKIRTNLLTPLFRDKRNAL